MCMPLIRRNWYWLPGLALLLLGACSESSIGQRLDAMDRSGPIEHGEVVVLSGLTLDGRDWTSLNPTPRATLINFWATWCGPCIEEIPSLLAIRERFEDEELRIVGITIDQGGPEDLRKFVEDQGMDYEIVLDADEELARSLGWSKGIPKTLLLDRDGRLAAFWWGKTDFEDPAVFRVIAAAVLDSVSP